MSLMVIKKQGNSWSAANGGSRDGGFKEIRGYLRKKAFFLRFLDFPGALRTLRKRAKTAEKGQKKVDFGQFPGRVARHPLNPHLLHPHLRQPKSDKHRARELRNLTHELSHEVLTKMHTEGVFIEKGPFFTVKGPRTLPRFHAVPRPSQREGGGGFTENPSRGSPNKAGGEGPQGGGLSVWYLGSARGPFTVKKRPLFDENALRECTRRCPRKCPRRLRLCLCKTH